MATEYVDYLILGDEHHGEIHRDIKSHSLRVRATGPARSGSPDRCAAPPAGKESGFTVDNAVARV
ncbi:TPA: hypothetical protein RQO69_006002 [Klebsiella oxytoca]|nr:hypothetical protein [Klebsiella oxytoca]HDX9083808.1 hypothetical protein [Klebsiella oxytoca]